MEIKYLEFTVLNSDNISESINENLRQKIVQICYDLPSARHSGR